MDTPARVLQLPLTEEAVRSLSLGEMVHLTGEIVITAGIPTHERIIDYLDRGEALPIDLTNAAFFHLGSFNQEDADGFKILYMNPTTSTRFNALMPRLDPHLRAARGGRKGRP